MHSRLCVRDFVTPLPEAFVIPPELLRESYPIAVYFLILSCRVSCQLPKISASSLLRNDILSRWLRDGWHWRVNSDLGDDATHWIRRVLKSASCMPRGGELEDKMIATLELAAAAHHRWRYSQV